MDYSQYLAGGLAGSILTIIYQWVKGYWLKPRIQICFQSTEPGCSLDTNSVQNPQMIVGRHVRLKIKNTGRSTALGVSVCITRLTLEEESGLDSSALAEDVLDLRLAYHADAAPFLLAPGAHRFVDLAHTDRNVANPLHWLDLQPHPTRLRQRGFGTRAGTCGAEIFVAAENAKAKAKFVKWAWDGGFPGLTIPLQDSPGPLHPVRLLRVLKLRSAAKCKCRLSTLRTQIQAAFAALKARLWRRKPH